MFNLQKMYPGARYLAATAGLIAAVAALSACDSAPSDAGYTVRDSSGVRIIENERAAWTQGAGWTVGPEPRLSIGGESVDSAYLFHRVMHTHRMRDGRIALAHASMAEVRIFSPEGRHLASFGRRGEGPGEFRTVVWLGSLPGDSLLVLDIGFNFSLFDPDGAYVRSLVSPEFASLAPVELIDRFSDGSMLVRRQENVRPLPMETSRTYVSLFRLAANGELLDSLGRFPHLTTESGGLQMWGAYAHEAAGDTTFFHGPADRFEIEERAWDGPLVRVIRLARVPHIPTQAEIAAAREELMNSPNVRLNPELARRIAAIPFASVLPSYFRLHTDAARNLWVQEYALQATSEGRLWSVFDTTGVYLGDVEMPERFRVDEIGADYVLGVWHDQDDVEYVRMYSLVKDSGE